MSAVSKSSRDVEEVLFKHDKVMDITVAGVTDAKG